MQYQLCICLCTDRRKPSVRKWTSRLWSSQSWTVTQRVVEPSVREYRTNTLLRQHDFNQWLPCWGSLEKLTQIVGSKIYLEVLRMASWVYKVQKNMLICSRVQTPHSPTNTWCSICNWCDSTLLLVSLNINMFHSLVGTTILVYFSHEPPQPHVMLNVFWDFVNLYLLSNIITLLYIYAIYNIG